MNHLKTLSLQVVREGGGKGNAAQRHSHDKEQGPVERKVEEGRDACTLKEGHAVVVMVCFWKNQAESVFPREDVTEKSPARLGFTQPCLCPD